MRFLLLSLKVRTYNACMLELKFKNTQICLDFSFFAVLTLFLMFYNTNFGVVALAACGIHEFSHLLAMTICRVKVQKITFYGAGVRISSPQTDNSPTWVRLTVLSAGCTANFIAAVVYWVHGNEAAAMINLLTGVFNLLPIGEHDGAELIKMLLIKICRPENVDKIMRYISISTELFLTGLILFSGNRVPFVVITTLLYILIMCVKR